MALACVAGLSGCLALDREAAVRDAVRQWVFLAQTRHFTSRPTCTAARFDVLSDRLRSTGVVRARSVREAAALLSRGRAVAFDMPGRSPNAISEALMSIDLPLGLGLISAVVGPSRACMGDVFAADVAVVLQSPDTIMVYDPGGDAVLLLYRPAPVAFFMRGNV